MFIRKRVSFCGHCSVDLNDPLTAMRGILTFTFANLGRTAIEGKRMT